MGRHHLLSFLRVLMLFVVFFKKTATPEILTKILKKEKNLLPKKNVTKNPPRNKITPLFRHIFQKTSPAAAQPHSIESNQQRPADFLESKRGS